MHTAALRPIALRPCARPTVVVLLPSPSGVGVIAVTTTYLPFGRSVSSRRMRVERDLRLGRAVQLELLVADPEVGRHVDDRSRADGPGDLEVGREGRGGHQAPRVTGSGAASERLDMGPGLGLRRANEVAEQEGVRQRTDAARHGRDRRGDPARADSKSTSPTSLPSTTLIPTSTTTAPGLSMSPGDEARVARRDDDDVGRADVCREVDRPRVADGDRRVLAEEQERRRQADDGRPADDDRVLALDLDPGAAQDLDRRMRGRGQEAVVAEAEQAGVQRMDAVDVLGRVDRVDDRAQPDRRRQRHLDDDPVDTRVLVEGPDLLDDAGLRCLALDLDEAGIDADLRAESQDLLEVDRRRSVLADDHDRQ